MVNQSCPSGPAVISVGLGTSLPTAGTVNSVTIPVVVIRAIFPIVCSVNHSAPSGPAVIDWPTGDGDTDVYSVITPAVVMRPILPAAVSVNQSAPSEPTVMAFSPLLGVGTGYSVNN